MKIIIKATDEIFAIWTSKLNTNEHSIIQYRSTTDPIPEADLYVDHDFEEEGPAFSSIQLQPILVNAVLINTAEMPANFVRFNGWGGFITQPKIEIAGNTKAVNAAIEILTAIGIETVISADEIGMIGPRVVSMIINEAYFALQEEVSTKEEIDTAMKMGTNYPYGPFEWCEKIGIHNIKNLLAAMAKTNKRYTIAPALIKN